MPESTLELVMIGRDQFKLERFELKVNMPKARITRLTWSTECRDHACDQQPIERSLGSLCVFSAGASYNQNVLLKFKNKISSIMIKRSYQNSPPFSLNKLTQKRPR